MSSLETAVALTIALTIALASLALTGCGGAPMAGSVGKLPDRKPISEAAERYQLSYPVATVEADVSAVGSYTLSFSEIRGTLSVDRQALHRSEVDIEIGMKSLTSSLEIVETIAKSEDFLDVEQFPNARFTSRAIELNRDGVGTLWGVLELHGVARKVAVPLWLSTDNCRIRFASEFTINRRDYKVSSDTTVDGIVSDDVELRIGGDITSTAPACQSAQGTRAPPSRL